jgi:hypothetical protein
VTRDQSDQTRRTPIPAHIAARVLFSSDRTCCICRAPGKAVQIHHIDGDPSNHDLSNLAVLCLEHHRDTQIQGGFDRKLDAHQIILYRDDWEALIARRRASREVSSEAHDSTDVEAATSIADELLANDQYELLAYHFDNIGNSRLRDKYIEIALERDPSDSAVVYLRALQGRQDKIPDETAKRHLASYTRTQDWLQRARAHAQLRQHREAVTDYVRGIGRALNEERTFSAAFYLKELRESGLIEELFILAFGEAVEEDDLWWQVRALQELGWHKELSDLVLKNKDRIEEGGDPMLLLLLAEARGDREQALELKTRVFGGMRLVKGRDVVVREGSEDEIEEPDE